MINWGVILVFVLFLSACGTSESAIQTAIAETEISKPTETYTLSPTSTFTVTSSPTITPSETPSPTVTPSPTITPTATEPVALKNMVLSYRDITDVYSDLAFMWGSNPVEIGCPFIFDVDVDVNLECYAIGYLPSKLFFEPLKIQLTRIDGDGDLAMMFSEQTNVSLLVTGKRISLIPRVVLPGDACMVEDDESVILGASQGNIFWVIVYGIFEDSTGDILSGHLSLLGQRQMNILIDNGYE